MKLYLLRFIPRGIVNLRKLLTLSILILTSSCGGLGVEVQMGSGEYLKLTRQYERHKSSGESLSDFGIFTGCVSYSETKEYKKLFECLPEVEKFESLPVGLYTYPRAFVLAEANITRLKAYLDLGDFKRAISAGEKAIRILDENNFLTNRKLKLGALSYLTTAYSNSGDKKLTATAVRRLESLDIDSFMFMALAPLKQLSLARAYFAIGDYESAKNLMSKEAGRGLGGFGGALFGVTWAAEDTPLAFMLAKSHYETGDYVRARALYEAFLKIPGVENFNSILWKALHDLGNINRKDKQSGPAVKQFKHAIELIERQRASIDAESNRIGFIGDKQEVYQDLVSVLVQAGRAEEAFAYAERGKARALVDLLATKKSFGGRQDPQMVRGLLDELDELERKSLLLASADTGGRATRSIKDTQKEILATAPELGTLVTVSTLGASEILSLLKPDEALVEYFYQGDGDGNVYAFVLTGGSVKAFTLPAKGLEGDVGNFRTAIDAHKTNDWEKWSAKLYDRLIAPLRRAIGNAKHLTIVPHGALHYLPFNALKPRNGKFLIEGHTIRLLPSASVSKFLNKSTTPTAGLLVFGNPDRSDAPALPGAENEARAIAKLWPDSKVILRKNATESLLKRSAGAFKYLHLASHGQFNPDDPLKSRMLLSADNDNDGDLTVPEIYDLKLNADMVVLSACETALGEVKNGDDVVGLNRGFLYAGAKSIVGSLWPVPDNPTKDFMVDLYTNLKSMDQRTALQKAQLTNLRKYKHPIAWAAFQMTGGT